jgi:hypothetical protein
MSQAHAYRDESAALKYSKPSRPMGGMAGLSLNMAMLWNEIIAGEPLRTIKKARKYALYRGR